MYIVHLEKSINAACNLGDLLDLHIWAACLRIKKGVQCSSAQEGNKLGLWNILFLISLAIIL